MRARSLLSIGFHLRQRPSAFQSQLHPKNTRPIPFPSRTSALLNPNPQQRTNRTPKDIVLFLLACVCLLLSKWGIELLPFKLVVRLFRLTPCKSKAQTTSQANQPRSSVAIAIKRAARYLPGEYVCLPQALAGKLLLRIQGRPSTLVLGVKTEPNRNMNAHAWLISENTVLLGGDIGAFTGVGGFE